MADHQKTTLKRQKTQRQRASGKARTATAQNARHDYTELIGVQVKKPLELVKLVEEGLAFSVVEALQEQMDLATKDMAQLLEPFSVERRPAVYNRLNPIECCVPRDCSHALKICSMVIRWQPVAG